MVGGGVCFFFSFSIENKKENGKNILYIFLGNLSRIPKLFFSHCSIKTEEVLLFIYIYLYIYKKLSPKWKNFHKQKVFLFLFYICSVNFSKIGPVANKEMGGKGGPNLTFFNVYFLYLFIYLSNSYIAFFQFY